MTVVSWWLDVGSYVVADEVVTRRNAPLSQA